MGARRSTAVDLSLTRAYLFQAAGEGEAELGALNKRNLIDGVITADGDTFVFGVEKVFRM
jgi:hypothetical protein